jgi:hypothetical protein
MDSKTLERLRPKEESSAEIRESLRKIREETESTKRRLTCHVDRRNGLLLTGTAAEIKSAEESARDCEIHLARLSAMTAELEKSHAVLTGREGNNLHAHRISEATEAIDLWNDWFSEKYEPLAAALAEGLEIERAAIQKINALRVGGAVPSSLPRLKLGYVGKEARAVGFLVRLPAVELGKPFWWP